MDHKGLPVAGYKAQSEDKVALVNRNKEIEERCCVSSMTSQAIRR